MGVSGGNEYDSYIFKVVFSYVRGSKESQVSQGLGPKFPGMCSLCYLEFPRVHLDALAIAMHLGSRTVADLN